VESEKKISIRIVLKGVGARPNRWRKGPEEPPRTGTVSSLPYQHLEKKKSVVDAKQKEEKEEGEGKRVYNLQARSKP